jgi:hypothetical protein
VFSQTAPAADTSHAAGRSNHSSLVNCSYDSGLVDASQDPETPGGIATIEFSGTVGVGVAGGR